MHARQCREDRQQVGCAAIGTTWLLWKRKLQEWLSADGRREQHVHCDPWTRIGPQGQGDQSAKGPLARADGIHMHLKRKNLATAVYGPFLPFTGVILCFGHCIGSIRF